MKTIYFLDPSLWKNLGCTIAMYIIIDTNKNSVGYLHVLLENKPIRFAFDENLGSQCLIQVHIRLFLSPLCIVICTIRQLLDVYCNKNKIFVYSFFFVESTLYFNFLTVRLDWPMSNGQCRAMESSKIAEDVQHRTNFLVQTLIIPSLNLPTRFVEIIAPIRVPSVRVAQYAICRKVSRFVFINEFQNEIHPIAVLRIL